MALQDLTPQLRTRLSRVERLVGLFVFIAVILLISGFAYFLYHTSRQKGWFLEKVPYHTMVADAIGLKLGDPVRLMGFNVGEITEIETMPPDSPSPNNVFVKFIIREPYYGYLWKDSKVKVTAADFLGNRILEVTKGTVGPATVLETNRTVFGQSRKKIVGILDDRTNTYIPLEEDPKGYYLPPDEAPSLNERVDQLVTQVEEAIPPFLNLQTQLGEVLTSASRLTDDASATLNQARPIMTNLVSITDHLRDPQGSLGEWLLPLDIRSPLTSSLQGASLALTNANTLLDRMEDEIATLSENINKTLENLAAITSNLNAQVQANTNILSSVSKLVQESDEMVQGLKRHWFLRSAFKEKRTRPVPRPKDARRGKLVEP